jgi:hypothetical protein
MIKFNEILKFAKWQNGYKFLMLKRKLLYLTRNKANTKFKTEWFCEV